MKNKIIIIVLVVIILGAVGVNIYILTNKDNTVNNHIEGLDIIKNEDLVKDTKVENLDITDIKIVTKDNMSTYKAVITNNTKSEISIDKLYVVFYQNKIDNKILATADLTLKPGENREISILSEEELNKSTKIEYVVE